MTAPDLDAPTPDDLWSGALDAFEEWVRRTAQGLQGSEPAVPGQPPPLPPGLVPAALRLRAQLVAAALHDVETEVLRLRARLDRERTYGAA